MNAVSSLDFDDTDEAPCKFILVIHGIVPFIMHAFVVG